MNHVESSRVTVYLHGELNVLLPYRATINSREVEAEASVQKYDDGYWPCIFLPEVLPEAYLRIEVDNELGVLESVEFAGSVLTALGFERVDD